MYLRIEFAVKKEGLGGGGMRCLKFQSGTGEAMVLKPSGKTATVSIAQGLPKDSSKETVLYNKCLSLILKILFV